MLEEAGSPRTAPRRRSGGRAGAHRAPVEAARAARAGAGDGRRRREILAAATEVDQLRSIGQVYQELLDAVVDYLADGNEWAAERLSSQPGWVLDAALREGNSKAFAELLSQVEHLQARRAETRQADRAAGRGRGRPG